MTTKALPKTTGACADEMYTIDQELAELSRTLKKLPLTVKMADLAERRKALEAWLIETLPASDADGVVGKLCRATVTSKRVPTVQDWPKLYAHVLKTKSFDLLHKRISNDAVAERWNDKKEVPGVVGFTVKRVSITKK